MGTAKQPLNNAGLNRRDFLTLAGAAGASFPFIGSLSQTLAAAQSKRNVIFILIDDMRYDSMSCTGHPFLQTPNLDRMAQNGVLFENAFVTTAL